MEEIDKSQIEKALREAIIQEWGTAEQRSGLRDEIGGKREFCSKRGFHRISVEKPGLKVCEDCGLLFDDSSGAIYKVDPD